MHTSGYAQTVNVPLMGYNPYGSTITTTADDCDRPPTPLNEAQNAADRIEQALYGLLSQLNGSVESLIGSIAEPANGKDQASPRPGGRVHALSASLANCERLVGELQAVANRLSSV